MMSDCNEIRGVLSASGTDLNGMPLTIDIITYQLTSPTSLSHIQVCTLIRKKSRGTIGNKTSKRGVFLFEMSQISDTTVHMHLEYLGPNVLYHMSEVAIHKS